MAMTEYVGYTTVVEYDKTIHCAMENIELRFNELKVIHLEIALLTINASKKRRTVKIDDGSLKRVLSTHEGLHEFYGDTSWLKTTHSPTENKVEMQVKVGQVSRLAIAWWTDPQNTVRTIRIFGDRIHLKVAHPVTPRLVSFGLNPYNAVYPNTEVRNDHCGRCKKRFYNQVESYYLEDPPTFLCGDCKYHYDSGGLLPGRK
jgi:hypothetical protein